jgi:hypothetical protein
LDFHLASQATIKVVYSILGAHAIGADTSKVTDSDLALFNSYIATMNELAASATPQVVIAHAPNFINTNGTLKDLIKFTKLGYESWWLTGRLDIPGASTVDRTQLVLTAQFYK